MIVRLMFPDGIGEIPNGAADHRTRSGSRRFRHDAWHAPAPARRSTLLALTVAIPAPVRPQDAAVARRPAAALIAVADVSYVSFSDATVPWRLASVALSRPSSAGTFIVRLNYANRFATDGVPVEADAYPRVNDKSYLYLNAGYRNAAIFPEWRAGGEVFTALPGAWEASAGFRQLHHS